MKLVAALVVLAACGPVDAKHPDARVVPDVAPTPDMPPQPFRHVITIDGVDDFSPTELFSTTSTSFSARITWDDENLYVGYEGPDLSTTTSDADKKWLFVYVDTAAGGETQSQQYNTQRATFPGTFAADYYARYKVDGTFASLEHASGGGTWTSDSSGPTTGQSGTFAEMAIPLSKIGAGASLDIVTYMINEKALAEGTFAGLYLTNFTDGYSTNMPLTAYLHVDFTSQRNPNDDANKRP
ncbi:MAG TPA: hypothetical protein VL326_10880 [Kofleriaceae bacterium]|nr:hypothetical protein [Kofleriaceae bacterium]